MSILSAMYAAVTGLNAQSTKLSAISDNISNSSTTGYKRVEVEFSSMVTQQISRRSYSAGGAASELGFESAPLFHRIVELAEGVRHFEAADVQLESLDGVGIVGLLLGQRGYLGWKVVHKCWLDQVVLVQPFEDLGGDFAGAPTRLQFEL